MTLRYRDSPDELWRYVNQADVDRWRAEVKRLQADLAETRTNAALVVHALDAALQWSEALFAWVPEGTTLPEGVKTAKGALDQAVNAIRSKQS